MNKIIFAGTPEIAAGVLEALVHAKYDIICCLTQPDRPSGRGLQVNPSAVKACATRHNIPVLQPISLKSTEVQQQLNALHADLMLVLAYGLILPTAVLSIPRLGCVNIHASLLPRWRGAAPIQHAILAGDEQSGITIMQMDAGMDTGDMLATYPCSIDEQETSASLHAKLSLLAQTSCLDALPKILQSQLQPQPQEQALATYAPKITKEQALINWSEPAATVLRAIRAYTPWPIAYTSFMQQPVKIWQAELVNSDLHQFTPGTIINKDHSGLLVACGQGIIRVLVMQFPNKKALPCLDICNANHALAPGATFS